MQVTNNDNDKRTSRLNTQVILVWLCVGLSNDCALNRPFVAHIVHFSASRTFNTFPNQPTSGPIIPGEPWEVRHIDSFAPLL